jgi:flagellar biosynthetic protein FliQ
MPPELLVSLGRSVLKEVATIIAPILGTAVVVSLLINVVQVLTSIQETTISTVPRLMACASAVFILLPWIVRNLGQFTVQMLSDFHPYLR